MRYSIFLLAVLSIMSVSGVAFAQVGANADVNAGINVDMVPENPRPYEVVSVSLTSYITNINFATITWKVDGKTQRTGKGQKTFSFRTGDINTDTVLDIVVDLFGPVKSIDKDQIESSGVPGEKFI